MNVLSASIFIDAGNSREMPGGYFYQNRHSYGIDLNVTGFLWYRFPIKVGLDVAFLGDNKPPVLKPYVRIGFF
jgi:hypothetical protein